MKSKYPVRLLELAYGQYKRLREKDEYKIQFEKLQELKERCRSASSEDERSRSLLLLVDLSMKIKTEWGLQMPISPYLKLERKDIYKSVRPNSSLAKFVYAFNIENNPALVGRKIAKKTVSKRMKELDLRVRKYLCYSMHKVQGASNRMLARRFGISKDTAANWIEDVDNWSEDERKAVASEAATAKAASNIDVLNLPERRLVSSSELEYGLTEGGSYKTGRKSKHKSADKTSDEE